MAITFLSIPTDVTLTSALGDVHIACGALPWVQVEVCNHKGTAVLSERLYAVDGRVTLHGIGELCQEALVAAGYSFGCFEITATASGQQAVATLKMLYCDRYTPYEDAHIYLRDNYLTTHALRRIARGGFAALSFYAQAGETVDWHIAVTLRDTDSGAVSTARWDWPSPYSVTADGVQSISVFWSYLQAVAGDKEVLQYTVNCGNRSATFFVDPALKTAERFLFRNCFNVREELAVPMLSTAKTTVEQSLATSNGTTQPYDRRPQQTHEVECGPLTAQEAEWLQQLVTSYDVVRVERVSMDDPEDCTEVPVLITETTCEVSGTDERPNTLKFAWRYADNRPPVRLSSPVHRFSETFNTVFS